MANNIIQTSELLTKLNALLAENKRYLDEAAASGLKYSSSLKPSDYTKALKEQETSQKNILAVEQKIQAQKDKMFADRQKQIDKEIASELRRKAEIEKAYSEREKQINKVAAAEARAQKARETQVNKESALRERLNRQRTQEEKLLARTTGLYNQIQLRVNKLSLEYNNLAAKKAINARLSRSEASQLEFLQAQLNKYQGILKNVDSNIGKHQRNVGNYASGWNGLSNSINQLTREMPAFANSVQTGFMALSNNIPILVDEINRLSLANKALVAQGKPTVSVFKQIMSSLLSLQTLMGVGITLLVVYGKEIGEWAKGLMAAKNSTDDITDGIREFDEETVKSIGRLKGLSSIVNDVTKSEKERLGALKSINAEYPELNTNLTLEKENLDKVNNAVKEYIRLAIQKKKLIILEEKIGELVNETVIAQQKLNKLTINENDMRVKSYNKLNEAVRQENISFTEKKQIMDDLNNAYANLTPKQREYVNLVNKISANEIKLNDIVEDYIDIEDHRDKTRKKVSKTMSAIRNLESKDVNSLTKEVLEQIKMYEEVLAITPKMTQEYFFLEKQIENLKETLTGIDFDVPMDALNDWSKDFEKTQKKIAAIHKKYADERRDYEKQISIDIENIAKGLADSILETMYNKQTSEIEAEETALERRYENAILFAEDNAAAQAEINRQRAAQEDALAEKKAKADKKAFLLEQAFKVGEIAIDTIQKVAALKAQSAVLLSNPVTAALAGIPLANIPIVIQSGAIASGAVLAQSIPAFWQGGEVGGSQQIMVNDDPFGRKGSNYKEVIEKPNGQLLTPQGKNAKVTVPKGSFVHPTYDAFINSLDSELLGNNIMPVGQNSIMPMIINNGLTKGEVMDVMMLHGHNVVNAINKKESFSFNYDERGARISRKKEGAKRTIMNARYSGKGMGV